MNTLKGEIVSLKVDGAITLVKAKIGEAQFTAIIIDTPETVEYLKMGHEIDVVFKETEVVLGTPGLEGISLQNRLAGRVTHIQSGELLSRLTIATPVGPISSIVTTNAVAALQLAIDSEVIAMVKTNEVMLATS